MIGHFLHHRASTTGRLRTNAPLERRQITLNM